ncbi:MAG TPA: cytochrome c biogenesis protein ResB [Blastocatellia bacterium]|nr:cytochrome c biogenesis protein ResB [Blastocatellia bacterium]
MALSESNVRSEAEAVKVSADSAPLRSADESASARSFSGGSIVDSILKLLSSVRFGLVMLGILLTCCMLGMLIMQVNVEGFQRYYNNLSPASRAVFGRLGFFDIYHSWYFSLLLAITGLNIILASIDRFPTAWQYIAKPKLNASPKFIRAQMYSSEQAYFGKREPVADQIALAWRRLSFKARISEEQGRTTVFAQRFAWNRLGAYAVHIALLTIFTGGFLTNRYGVGGSMQIEPGRVADKFTTMQDTLDGPRTSTLTLPFKIECLDLQQKLIRPEGGLDQQNTIDWLSFIRIVDSGTQKDLLVHLNNVGNYRGYRFFQSQFSPVGNAREITIAFQPVNGGAEVTTTLGRKGSSAPQTAEVPGIGRVSYVGFYPDFDVSGNDFVTRSGEYNRPVAELDILGTDGQHRTVLALGSQAATDFLDEAERRATGGGVNQLLYNGNRVLLKSFDKVSGAHTLTVQYDPGRTPVYIGFVLLLLSLCSVFFFSHQRVWAVLEAGESDHGGKLFIGGNVNRNRQAFEATFQRLAAVAEEEKSR